jgi:ribosome-associated translation inhibitor RaiA
MRLQIGSRNLTISQALRGSIERRLRFVLGRFGSKIDGVNVHLAEWINPHGRTETRCRVVARLLSSGRLSVEDSDPDLGAVVNRAFDRIGQSVRRELDRQHEQSGRKGALTRR